MPRRKKIISSPEADAMPVDPKPEIKQAKKEGASGVFNLQRKKLTKESFVLITGLMSLFVASLVFTASFATVSLNGIINFPPNPACCQNNQISLMGGIIYGIDKSAYQLSDKIRVNIINNSNKSIYLAPCQYFNKFEKKVGSAWQATDLSACNYVDVQPDNTFEKIPQKVEDTVAASVLGEGLWRGISNVYFDCKSPSAETCKSQQKIYSKEFKIKPAAKSISSEALSTTPQPY